MNKHIETLKLILAVETSMVKIYGELSQNQEKIEALTVAIADMERVQNVHGVTIETIKEFVGSAIIAGELSESDDIVYLTDVLAPGVANIVINRLEAMKEGGEA